MTATVMAVPSAHHEGRGDAGPEQSLCQREDQHQDRARARSQPDRHDRGEPALPSAWSGKLLGLGRMRMSPGRGVIVRDACCVMVAVMMLMLVMLMVMPAAA